MKRFFDKAWTGIGLGIIGPFCGFWLYFLYYLTVFPHRSADDYMGAVIANTALHAPVTSISLLFNLLLFLLLNRAGYYYGARGVLAGTFLYVPVVLFFKFI